MGDNTDAVAQALALARRLAASRLIRKEELEAELNRLRGERPTLPAGELADAVDARIAALGGELAAADHDLKAALREVDELRKLGRQAKEIDAGVPAALASAASGDPVLRSAEENALDNAR